MVRSSKTIASESRGITDVEPSSQMIAGPLNSSPADSDALSNTGVSIGDSSIPNQACVVSGIDKFPDELGTIMG